MIESHIETQVLHCKRCEHEWKFEYIVPMPLTEAAKLFQTVTCPHCSAGSQKIVMLLGSEYHEALERINQRG